MSAVNRLSAVLRAHAEVEPGLCKCGWHTVGDGRLHRNHVVAESEPILADVWDDGAANGIAFQAGAAPGVNPYRGGTP